MRVGAQIPMAGGLLCALDYAVATGCEAIQIFAKSPRRWVGPPLDPDTCKRFRDGCAEAGIGPVFTHASYLINMGSDDPDLWERSIHALADELLRAGLVGAAGLVVHLGRRYSDDDVECVQRVAAAAARAAEVAAMDVPALLLENSAGAGRQFGVSVDEMTAALSAVQASGVTAGLCIDTCHALAGGIDVRTAVAWSHMLAEVEACCGAGAVALIHANDCKGDLGSHSDRHEWIGDGCVGESGFAAMFAQPSLARASAVVEMPGEAPYKDEENIRRLKRLRDGVSARGGPDPARA
jgi:deoxyribonuclease IV